MICPRLPSWFVLITRHSTSEGWKGISSSAISSRILAMLKPNCGAGAGTAAEELCRGESAGRTLAGCFLGAVTEVSLIKSGDGQFSSREKGLLSRFYPCKSVLLSVLISGEVLVAATLRCGSRITRLFLFLAT